jgi:hypothetical protein
VQVNGSGLCDTTGCVSLSEVRFGVASPVVFFFAKELIQQRQRKVLGEWQIMGHREFRTCLTDVDWVNLKSVQGMVERCDKNDSGEFCRYITLTRFFHATIQLHSRPAYIYMLEECGLEG